ncbi:hypothetical protein AB6D56_00355 [Vibrio lentus]
MRFTLLIFSFLLFTGCANKYIPPQGSNTATINISAKSDSIELAPNIIMHVVYSFDDLNCSEPKEIESDTYSELNIDINDIKISVGKPFVFGVKYSESRGSRFMTCSSLNSFIPVQGKTYQAEFEYYNKINSCDVTVTELSPNGNKVVDIQEAERTCFIDLSRDEKFKNGVAVLNKTEKLPYEQIFKSLDTP